MRIIMSTKAGNENGTPSKGKKLTAKQRRARKQRKIIIFAVEIIVILVMLVIVWQVFQTTNNNEGPHFAEFDQKDIILNSGIEENEVMKGYWNIALFGIDVEDSKVSSLYKGKRSDTIMIASVNQDTGEIKLVSVYRDTYLNLGNDRYNKANSAYSAGCAEQAIMMLNMNRDLNITDFVAVGYKAIKEVVDGLGGVYINVDSEELKHINNYQIGISEFLGQKSYNEVKTTGYQLLDGLQAAAYCRIRYRSEERRVGKEC